MKLATISYSSPWGFREFFVTRENFHLRHACPDLLIVPLVPEREAFHAIGASLVENALWLPLFSLRMLPSLFWCAVRHPLRLASIVMKIIASGRNARIIALNLAVLLKSVYVARIMSRLGVVHIYVNWATTPASMGYIISELIGIPWSLQAHRWDIYQDNMLRQKVESAQFVFCVSEMTKRALLEIVGHDLEKKVFVKALGVQIEPMDISLIRTRILSRRRNDRLHFVTPANFVPVKGHHYLLDACVRLIADGFVNFRLTLFGDGPLKQEIEERISKEGLRDFVEIKPPIPNENLLKLYRDNQVDIVILPSITTEDGEHEGLPIVLVEAMSFGIPVISTNTGGIPELLSDGAGVIVEEKSGYALACAIENLIRDPELAVQVAIAGREKVASEYNIVKTIELVLSKIQDCPMGHKV